MVSFSSLTNDGSYELRSFPLSAYLSSTLYGTISSSLTFSSTSVGLVASVMESILQKNYVYFCKIVIFFATEKNYYILHIHIKACDLYRMYLNNKKGLGIYKLKVEGADL